MIEVRSRRDVARGTVTAIDEPSRGVARVQTASQIASGRFLFPPVAVRSNDGDDLPSCDRRVPALTVLCLSDSFGGLWPDVAASAGLTHVIAPDSTALGLARGGVALIAAGGEETRVEETLRAIGPGDLGIAVVGSIASHRLAVSVVRAGAAEYFALPQDASLLRSWVGDRADRLRANASRKVFAAAERAKYAFEGILGDSPSLKQTLDRASRVIPHPNVTVLITGETGTGKELLARAIHYNGPRRESPFVDINCTAIPEQLLESELFGHEKGSFTGASSAKPGLFEMADGGTIFLDEIGHLAPTLQGKILRVLEERRVRRVGGARSAAIDVRVVAATHVDLLAAMRRGEFREDLYYRLNVVPLQLPPLRERQDDIVPLARHFLARFASEYNVPDLTLTPAAEQALKLHAWSGNVRELRNAMDRAVLLSDSIRIDAVNLALDDSQARREGSLPFPATLAAITRIAVEEMLLLCDGNKSEAARRLAISRPRLIRLLDPTFTSDTSARTGDTDD